MGPAPPPQSVIAPERLRLIVITDATLAAPRSVEGVVEAALAAGAPAVQLRAKGAHAADLLPAALRLRTLCRRHGALFFVNDRLDVALAAGADGVHLGPDDLPVVAARRIVPPDFLVGYSADDPVQAVQAQEDGADYLGCGTLWPTGSKVDAGDTIGLDGLRRVVEAVRIPVVGIGGIHPGRAAGVAGTGAAGCAVIGAIMAADDPADATRGLLAPFG